jgi:hypothetical protein
MAINNKKYLLLAIVLFVFTSFLSAQEAGYFIEEKGDEVKYVQRFVWRGGENALYYEVIFERETNGTYSQYLKETTKAQFIEVSLPPGNYRFRVIPYDILGRPTEGSQWVNVAVLPVPKPEEYEELKPESKTVLKPEPEPEPESEEEEVKPEKEKTVFFRVGTIFGIGGRMSLYGNRYFGDSGDSYVGLYTNIVFKTSSDIYIGPEFTVDLNRYGNIENWKLFFYTFGINLLAEKWSPKKIFGVGLRFGLLYPSIDIKKNWHEMTQEQREYFHNGIMDVSAAEEGFYRDRLIPNMGASLYFLIKKHLLLELGFNYLHMFSDSLHIFSNPVHESSADGTQKEFPSSGFFCPTIKIGYQF